MFQIYSQHLRLPMIVISIFLILTWQLSKKTRLHQGLNFSSKICDNYQSKGAYNLSGIEKSVFAKQLGILQSQEG